MNNAKLVTLIETNILRCFRRPQRMAKNQHDKGTKHMSKPRYNGVIRMEPKGLQIVLSNDWIKIMKGGCVPACRVRHTVRPESETTALPHGAASNQATQGPTK